MGLVSLIVLFQAHTLAPAISRAKESVLRVESRTGYCTGFVVGMTRVITAEHCIEEAENEAIVGGLPGRVVKRNGDFILLEIPDTGFRPLPLAKSVLHGEDVATLGYARGSNLHIYGRHVAAFDRGQIVLDGRITPGMSGGPVLNTTGEVVGLNQSTTEDRGFACPVHEIRDFVK